MTGNQVWAVFTWGPDTTSAPEVSEPMASQALAAVAGQLIWVRVAGGAPLLGPFGRVSAYQVSGGVAGASITPVNRTAAVGLDDPMAKHRVGLGQRIWVRSVVPTGKGLADQVPGVPGES